MLSDETIVKTPTYCCHSDSWWWVLCWHDSACLSVCLSLSSHTRTHTNKYI